MSRFIQWPEQVELSSRREVIVWWEKRRLAYNCYLIFIGFFSTLLCLFAGSAAVPEGEDFVEPMALFAGPIVYLTIANICYTLGWIYDMFFYCGGQPSVRVYKAGVIFSVIVTAAPGLWAVYLWLFTLVVGHKIQ